MENSTERAEDLNIPSRIGIRRSPMTPKEAAQFLGLDVKTVTRWARKRYLPAHPLGEGKRKFWRFFEAELLDWLALKSNGATAA